MPGESRHATIGHFLRTCRRRTNPASVGLPGGGRRRGTGLRREEVAGLANVSPTWYAYLEQGRRINPSSEVLDALATALRLDPAERRYLHRVAGSGDRGPDPDLDERALGLIEALVSRTDLLPYPVYAVSRCADLLCWNRHMAEWYGEFPGEGMRHRNLVWWMFTSEEAKQRIVAWETVARNMVARVRFTVGTEGPTPQLAAVLADLRASSSTFAAQWDDHRVTDRAPRSRMFDLPDRGRAELRLMSLRPTASSAFIVLHFPG